MAATQLCPYNRSMSAFYITTAIPYTNARPHIGFTLELLQADALARYHRLIGDETHFLTGTDEHGMKMVQTAAEAGLTPQQLADKNSAAFRELAEFFHVSNDQFIRTSTAIHKAGAQKLWTKLAEDEAIYKGKYAGLYCVGCEAYVTEKDLVNGKCPNHPTKTPEYYEEENYFFRYSKYLPQIKKLIEDGELKILPESRKTEMLNLIARSIEEKRDISFSRPAKALSWGIPVPNDPSHTMYIWCDALSNYITALDYEHEGPLYEKFWPANVHLIGKDILRFHAGFWIAMLLAAKVPTPRAIYVHGFITSEGQKMSKSLGNVVDPFEVGKTYGVEPVRYYLLREVPTADDGDWSEARFEALYQGELANNLGNLVSRVLTMTEKYSGGKVPPSAKDEAVVTEVMKTWKEYHEYFTDFNIKAGCEAVLRLLTCANRYVDETKPWVLAKTEPVKVHAILYHLLELLRHVSLMLTPILPQAAAKMKDALRFEGEKLYPDNIGWGVLKEGASVKKIKALFPRR